VRPTVTFQVANNITHQVGRFDFASKKLKVVRCDDSEVIIEIVLDRLEY